VRARWLLGAAETEILIQDMLLSMQMGLATYDPSWSLCRGSWLLSETGWSTPGVDTDASGRMNCKWMTFG
jgi:hypothetical protein